LGARRSGDKEQRKTNRNEEKKTLHRIPQRVLTMGAKA
jgi:hypothetical protein